MTGSRGRRWAWTGPGLAVAVAFLAAACSGDDGPAVERTERERDSLIGQSRLPGAAGVRGALEAQDSAAARRARLDSIAGTP